MLVLALKKKKKIQHIGNVVIEKNCIIGSNTTIDRAVFESTLIGEYSQIDNLVQIAHNVTIETCDNCSTSRYSW